MNCLGYNLNQICNMACKIKLWGIGYSESNKITNVRMMCSVDLYNLS